MSVPNMLALVGCILGYMLASILVDLGVLTGVAASIGNAIIPSACGLVVGLTAMRLQK